MIKNPFNFWVGVYCGMTFIADVSLHKDSSTLCVLALLTVFNLAVGLTG